MRLEWLWIVALLAATLSSPRAALAQDAPNEPLGARWVSLPAGAFFPAAQDDAGATGYAVLDERTDAPFWTSFTSHGGHAALGAPLSRPFGLPDARVYQVFEHATLRWTPGAETADIADTMDLLWATGRDEWLAERGVPEMRGAGAENDVLTRMSWLTDDAIRDTYFNAHLPDAQYGLPAALARFGLPASFPVATDNHVAQRFDRAVLVRDLATGEVSPLPVGTLLRESGLLPPGVLAPDRMIGGQLVLRAPRTVLNWPHARGWGVAEPALPPAPAQPPSPPPVATATPAIAPALAPPASTPTSRPVSAQPTPPAPAGANLQPGATLLVKSVVNQGRAEHVLIANEGAVAQELTGWSLRSGTGGQQVAFPAGFVLTSGGSVRVHSGAGASNQNRPPTDLFGTASNIWNNTGDVAILVDPTGRVIHQLSYGG